MKIGVIGLGSIGERHVRNLQKFYPKASIKVLTKRTSWPEAKRNTTLFSSEDIFFSEKCDAYIIANEPYKHTASFARCLKNSPKGIFIEKPLSHSLKGIRGLVQKARKGTQVSMVGYNLHFFGPLIRTRELVKKGVIGKPLFIRASVGQDLRTWRETDYRKNYAVSGVKGGGVVLDLIHDINYPSWILGEPLRFVAGTSARLSSLAIHTEDIAEGIFFSAKSKVMISVHQDYLHIPGGRRLEISGTKGTLVCEWGNKKNVYSIRVRTTSGSRSWRIREKSDAMYERELKAFIFYIQRGKRYSNLSEAASDLDNAFALRSVHLRV